MRSTQRSQQPLVSPVRFRLQTPYALPRVRPGRGLVAAQLLLCLYLLSTPLTDVLAVNGWTIPPFVIASALAMLCILTRPQMWFEREDVLLAIIVILVILPWCWSEPYITQKAINHLLAFVASIALYYFAVRTWIYKALQNLYDYQIVARILAILCFIASVFCLGEFVARNWLMIDPDLFVPHTTVTNYQVLAFDGLFRARGWSSESGGMATFFELALFLGIPAIRRLPKFTQLLYYVVCLCGFAVLFSVAGWVCLFAGGAVFILIDTWSNARRGLRRLVAIATLGIVLGVVLQEYATSFYSSSILPKIGGLIGVETDDQAESGRARRALYTSIAALTMDYPLGIGIGISAAAYQQAGEYFGIKLEPGQISLYGCILVAAGYPGLILFAIFAGLKIRKAIRAGNIGRILLPAGLALCLHHTVITEYWWPFLWLFFAFADWAHHKHRRASTATAWTLYSPWKQRTVTTA